MQPCKVACSRAACHASQALHVYAHPAAMRVVKAGQAVKVGYMKKKAMAQVNDTFDMQLA